MFWLGEDRNSGLKFYDDFRPELHDSDGLQILTSSGEWIWRSLRAPRIMAMSTFDQPNLKGFGLLQRDRNFDHYQDIELTYETRPSYFIEPHGAWGDGRIELLELATKDETADNIVSYWTPRTAPEAGKPFAYSYKIRSFLDAPDISPLGRVRNHWKASPKALGSGEAVNAGSKRFIVDFTGGDLPYYLSDPGLIEIQASISQGKVLRSFLAVVPQIKGFRAMIDVQVEPGSAVTLRAALRTGQKALTETWLEPWVAE
jgi:glucans biosynthesis protein